MDGDDFAYTREGAHSRPRILYHEDITGKEISEKLLQQVLKLENVTILEYTTMQDILVENGKCTGLKVVSAEANRARLCYGSRKSSENPGRDPAWRKPRNQRFMHRIRSWPAAGSEKDMRIPPTIRILQGMLS